MYIHKSEKTGKQLIDSFEDFILNKNIVYEKKNFFVNIS